MADRSPVTDSSVRLTFRLLVRETLAVYRARFARIAVPAVCVLVPISLIETVTEHLQHRFAHHTDVGVRILVAIEAFAAAAAGTIGLVFFAGLLDRLIGAYLEGREDPSVGEVLRGLPYGRLVGADLLYIALTFVGLALLVLPGLAVMTFFGIVGPLVTSEGLGVFRAFRESARLVRPKVFLVFFAVTVPVAFETLIDDGIRVAVWDRGFLVGLIVNAGLAVVVLATVALLEVVLAHGLISRDRANRATTAA